MTTRSRNLFLIHYTMTGCSNKCMEYYVFIIKKLKFFGQRSKKTRDFQKNQYSKFAKNSLNTLASRILSPQTLIIRNRCEIIFRAILKIGGGRLPPPPCLNWFNRYFPKDAHQKSEGVSEVRFKKTRLLHLRNVKKTNSSAIFCATGACGLNALNQG